MKNILKKLFLVQQEIKPIEKDSTNPFFNSAYFDINKIIDTIKPILNKHGLVVLQPMIIQDAKVALKTMVIDVESGEEIDSTCYLPENVKPQEMGGAITYFRRYALQSLLFLQAEDDDGNVSSQTQPKTNVRPVPPPVKTIQNPKNDLPFN